MNRPALQLSAALVALALLAGCGDDTSSELTGTVIQSVGLDCVLEFDVVDSLGAPIQTMTYPAKTNFTLKARADCADQIGLNVWSQFDTTQSAFSRAFRSSAFDFPLFADGGLEAEFVAYALNGKGGAFAAPIRIEFVNGGAAPAGARASLVAP